MRVNHTKEKILHILSQSHLLTIAEIQEEIQKIESIDYSTVYRNIDQLLIENKIKKINIDKIVKYELATHKHNHFICDNCGNVDSIDAKITHVSDKVKINDVVFHGHCDDCLK